MAAARVPFYQLPLMKRNVINQARLKKQATPAEKAFRNYLATLGVYYRFQQGFYSPFHRIVDFYLPDHNLIIEIDGPCHDVERDRRRDEWFTRARGIPILRLTNDQVLRGDYRALETAFRPKTVPTICTSGEKRESGVF